MTARGLAIALTCVTLAGCGGRPQPGDPGTVATPKAADTHAHAEDPNIVEVDESALRDLRTTTRPVESRAGGDVVMLLGELSVDERAYAEVGVPVAARVTRLVATTGDSVRAGETLAELVSPELGRERAEYAAASA